MDRINYELAPSVAGQIVKAGRYHRDDHVTDVQLEQPTGLTASFWRARRLRGDGPVYIKLSARCVRYRWGDVLDWLESLRRTSTSDQGGAA